MQWAALVAWVLTALGGAGLGYMWARGGGAAQTAGIRPWRLLLHAGLAVTGLAIWIVFLAEGRSVYAGSPSRSSLRWPLSVFRWP